MRTALISAQFLTRVTMKAQRSQKPAASRRAAEPRLKAKPAARQPATEADPRRLQHEVEVQQIELEMQNEELRVSRAKLETALAQYTKLYDFAPAGYFTLARDSRIRQANLTGASLLGIERSRLLKRRFSGFVATEARCAFGTLLARAFETQAPQSGVVTLSIEGKPRLTVLLQMSVAGDDPECRVVMADLSERTVADQAFQLSQQRLSLQVEQTPLAVIEFDVEGRVREWNPAAMAVFGYSREEALGQHWRFIVPTALQGHVDGVWASIVGQRGGHRSTNENVTKEGRTISCEWFNKPLIAGDGQTIGVASLIEDVTERKKAQEALGKSQEGLRLALEASHAGTWSWDAASKVSTWDARYHELYGFEPEEPAIHEAWLARVHPEDRQRLQARIEALLKPGLDDAWNEEFRALHPVKGERWMAGIGRVERDPSGRAVRFLGLNLDITQRKRTEAALRESEGRYRSLFANMLNGFAFCRMHFEQGRPHDFTYLEVNGAFEALTGLKNVVGKKATEAIPGIREADPGLFEIYGRVAQTGVPERFETFVQALQMWLDVSVYSPAPEHFVALFDVITERKRTEAALKLAHARLRCLVDSNIVGIVIANAAGKVIEANDYYLRLIGFTRAELEQGRVDWRAITPPQWLPADEKAIRELHVRGVCTPYEKEYVRRDGKRIPIFLADTLLPGPEEELAAFVLDLTHQKQAEAARRASEEQFRAMFDIAPIGIAQADPRTGRWLRVNPKMCEITGYSAAELLQMRVPDLTQAEDRQRDWDAFQRVVRGEARDYRLEKRYVRKDRSLAWVNVNVTVLRDAAGHPTRTLAAIEDITERKQAEESLREKEQRYRLLFNSGYDAVFVHQGGGAGNAPGKFIEVNDIACERLGYTREELLQMTPRDISAPETLADLPGIRAQLAHGEIGVFRRDPPLPSAGRRIPVEISTHVFELNGIPTRLSTVRDITERKRPEEALREFGASSTTRLSPAPRKASSFTVGI